MSIYQIRLNPDGTYTVVAPNGTDINTRDGPPDFGENAEWLEDMIDHAKSGDVIPPSSMPPILRTLIASDEKVRIDER